MDADAHDYLVQRIYGGVLDPTEWDIALAMLSELLGFPQACILLGDTAERGTSVVHGFNLDPDFAQQYEETYCVSDPGKEFVSRLAAGSWYFDDRLLSPAFKQGSGFYQDFMRPFGFTSNICASLSPGGHFMAGLSFQANEATSDFRESVSGRQLSSLIAHLRKAVGLRFRFDDISRKAWLGQQLVDRISAPVLIANRRADVLHANASGEAWLRNPGDPANNDAPNFFRKRLLSQVAGQLFARSHAVAVSVTPNTGSGCDSVVIGLPMTMNHPIGRHSNEALGMFIVHERRAVGTGGAALLGQLYGLSRAEQRFLVTWACHGSVRGTAEQLHVSLETVRSHLKSVLAKTGCERQIDLAKLVSQLSLLT